MNRPSTIQKSIVYTYLEFTGSTADGEETHTRYDCYITLIAADNITKTTEEVKNILKENGFRKIVVNSPESIGNGYFEITMNYKKIMEVT